MSFATLTPRPVSGLALFCALTLALAVAFPPLRADTYGWESAVTGFSGSTAASAAYTLAPTTTGEGVAATASTSAAPSYAHGLGFVARVGTPEVFLGLPTPGSSTVTFPTQTYGPASAAQQLLLRVYGRPGALTVQAPTGYEVARLLAGPYSPQLTFTETELSDGVYSVHLRLAAGVVSGVFSGSLQITGFTGNPTLAAAITGEVVRAAQSLTFSLPAAVAFATGSLALNGTTTASGLAPVYTVDVGSSSLSVSGSTLQFLAPVVATLTASQPGDSRYLPAAPITQNIIIHGPLPAADAQSKPARTTTIKVPVRTLLANDQRLDATGTLRSDLLTLTAISAVGGGSASLSGDHVLLGIDAGQPSQSFTYTLSDGTSTHTATVVLTTASPAAFTLQLIALGTPVFDGQDTRLEVAFLGVPGQTYTLEYTPSLAPATWTSLGPVATGPTGSFAYTLTAAGDQVAAWSSSLFFRALWTP